MYNHWFADISIYDYDDDDHNTCSDIRADDGYKTENEGLH